MADLSDERRKSLLAYCRIDVEEDGESALLQTLYDAAVAYMATAGVSEPEAKTDRRAQYDLCALTEADIPAYNALVLDAYDRRDKTITGTIVASNPAFGGMLVQLQVTEPQV